MKAVVYKKYGTPDVLKLTEVEKPVPGDNEILIRVHASSVSIVDCTFRKGESFFARLFTGLFRPKNQVLGGDFGGEIATLGENIEKFKPGDEVFGATGDGTGAHSEYVLLKEDSTIVQKPSNMTFESAVTAAYGFLTALPFLRDEVNLEKGQKILINGAGGSIGTFAIQIAKYYGAEVTAVCGPSNIDLVQSLGADKVIDYTQSDFTKNGASYDIIFDVVGKSSYSKCKSVLNQGGTYLTPVISLRILFQMMWTSKLSNKKAVISFTGMRSSEEKSKDLKFFKELYEKGEVKSVVDRGYPLEDIAEAHRYVENGHKRGNVIVTLNNS